MSQDTIVARLTGNNGRVELREDHIVITKPAADGNDQVEEEAIPILQIASIQFGTGSGFRAGPGFIHFTLLGEKDVADHREALRAKRAIVFESRQAQDFGQLKQQVESRLAALRIGLLNRPELQLAQARLEDTRPRRDLAQWLEKNTELIERAVESIGAAADRWAAREDKKITLQEQELGIGDLQHKRSVLLLGACLLVLFAICTLCILRDQHELVRWILSSSFALAAGAGIRELLPKRRERD